MEMVEANNSSIVANKSEEDQLMDLPPGFRFHPTDEEIITHYLMEKVMNINFSASAIGEVDMNKCEPWDLPKKAKMGEKEWYFFCQKDRKYPTGMRTNRATESGYWKATGKDKEIYKGKRNLVGMKKTLVFYKGRAPKGEKSNWVMHEYRLEGNFSYYRAAKQDEWVVSRIFHKSSGIKKVQFHDMMFNASNYLPPLMDPPYVDRSSSNHQYHQNKKLEIHNDDNIYNNYNSHMMLINTSNIEGGQNPYHHVPLSNLNPLLSNNNYSTYGSNSKNDSLVSGFEDQAILRALAGKGEQFSSSNNHNSMISQSHETGGVSNDMNIEISSVLNVPKQDIGIAELDCFWDY